MTFVKKINKLIRIIIKFKNPYGVIKFYKGRYTKGEKLRIIPRNNKAFYVARPGDLWLIENILKNKKVNTLYDKEKKQNYFIVNNIFLRQGTSDTFIYKEIFIDGCYKKCANRLTKGSRVIDIGAHIGLFSLYCSPWCNKIYAYEAHKENYNLAVKNVKNSNAGNIKIFNLAVSSKSGETVSVSDEDGAQTGEHAIKKIKPTGSGSEKLSVATIALQDIFKNNKIDFCDLLKMDIEGAEYAVLLSAPDEIFNKINFICMEYHPDLENKYTKDDLINFLKNKGFIVEINKIDNFTGLLFAKR